MLTFTYLAVYRKYCMRAALPCFWRTLAKHYNLNAKWIVIIGTIVYILLICVILYGEVLERKIFEPSLEMIVVSASVLCGSLIIAGIIYSVLRTPGNDILLNLLFKTK